MAQMLFKTAALDHSATHPNLEETRDHVKVAKILVIPIYLCVVVLFGA